MLDRWISSVQTGAVQETGLEPGDPALTRAVDRKIYEVTSAVSELVHGFEFARLLSLYYHAYVDGDDEMKMKVVRWFRGEYALKREAKEELGLTLDPGKLKELGFHRKKFEGEFYGRPFRDNQLSKVYLYIEAIDITKLTLQEEEVSEVIWMDYAKCKKGIQENTIRHCIYLDEFEMVGKGLGIDG